MKRFSEACERNKDAILEQLKNLFSDKRMSVLEIGSGTGQHAVHFAKHLPNLQWHTADLQENHLSIFAWIDDAKLENLHPPIILDVNQPPQNTGFKINAVFTANTTHIMSYIEVVKMFDFVERMIGTHCLFIIYGPFKYNGQHTSPSNETFDGFLRDNEPTQGIRDVSDLRNISQHLKLIDDIEMPANNRLLVFEKV